MKKNIGLFLLLFLISLKISATDTTHIFKKNAIFLEGGGKGPKYSINYSRIFRQGDKLVYSWRAGFSILSNDLSVPLAVSVFTGGLQHHLEISLGITPYLKGYKTFLHENDLSDKQLYITPGIGYRYQKAHNDFLLTAGFDPLIFMDPPSGDFWNFSPVFKPTAHLAFGFLF